MARSKTSVLRAKDLSGGHLRCHDADEIVRPEDTVNELDERLPDIPCPLDGNVVHVEEYDEDAAARIRDRLARGFHGRGVHALGLRAARRDDDVLEVLDGLGHPVLEDFEVLRPEVLNRAPATHRVDVDAHVIGLRSDRRLLRILRLPEARAERGSDEKTDGHSHRTTLMAVKTLCSVAVPGARIDTSIV